jgi:hypothetical protein
MAFAAAIGAAAMPAFAVDQALWYLQLDNDVVFNTDRWYSSGVRLARVKDGIEIGVLQEIYTPEAKHWLPGTADRAPAGRLLLSVARHDVTAQSFQTLELLAGVRGPASGARQTAQAIHRVFPAPVVDWSRQLPNELDGTLAAVRSQRAGAAVLHFGAQLGNQVAFAHAGIEARFGEGVGRLLRFAATPPLGTAAGWSGYAGASVRGVARNQLLARNYDPFGDDLRRRNAVTRFAAGLSWTQSWGSVSFEAAHDSREFRQQRVPDSFGSLAVHASF